MAVEAVVKVQNYKVIFDVYGPQESMGYWNECEKIAKSVALEFNDQSFENFIVGQCKEAIILGVLCTVGMWIFRFPYATMIGALIGFTALIPVAGAYIGASVGAVMILTESPIKALLFIVFIVNDSVVNGIINVLVRFGVFTLFIVNDFNNRVVFEENLS